MKQILNIFWLGIRESFKDINSLIIFVTIFLTFFSLFVFIPVLAVPGNTVEIQLRIFTLRDYNVLALLSFLTSLFITMQLYAIQQRKKASGVSTVTAGGLGALFAGFIGTAGCAGCLAPLFALFGIGFGGVVFVLEYRLFFVVGMTLIMLFAIYLTARKISNVCVSCQ